MNFIIPQTYLIALSVLLLIIAILVGRQLFKVQKDEMNLIKLEKEGIKTSKDPEKLYELASVQIKKRLYPQAITTLKQALKTLDDSPNEAKAIIENALGFSLAAQEDFKLAAVHYLKALKAKPDYPVAINNLAFAKQKLMEPNEAYKLYKDVLRIDPKNKTANKQIKKLEMADSQNIKNDKKGF